MKKFLLVATLLFLLPLIVTAQSSETNAEQDAVRRVVQTYLDRTDHEAVRRALAPEAKILSVSSRDGRITETRVSTPGRTRRDGTTIVPSQRIVAVDVTHGAAVVRVESEFPAGTVVTPQNHVQYISLLKANDDWKIVSILMPPLRLAQSKQSRPDNGIHATAN